MLSATAVDLTFDDDDWTAPPTRLYRAASVGNSWGVTDIGRGFDWASQHKVENDPPARPKDPLCQLSQPTLNNDPDHEPHFYKCHPIPPRILTTPYSMVSPSQSPVLVASSCLMDEPPSFSPSQSSSSSPQRSSLASSSGSPRVPPPRSPTLPRPRRRSSQQRVSLIAGRVLIAPIEPPSPPPSAQDINPLGLRRIGSASSLLSTAASTGPPTPLPERESFLGGRSISEFVIESEIGRGAYGLVKRAREIHNDSLLGPPLVIKQIIKSRILADCWKKHPKHGTIPIEIYVMSAISSTPYVLPPRRPWDPSRLILPALASPPRSNNALELNSRPISEATGDDSWVEGKVVYGHPNICPLADFFEDNHYYYLVLPSTTPIPKPNESPPPADLFDLVEGYPHGLPSSSVRSYLGQIADALCFLHSRGIVHRDIKDENVVLGPGGKCILIDFGSSGLVKKNGWDTFSGTLDYAGPEILRGERYQGKEQDVWAFGVVAYVLLVGECPFMTAAEAQDGLESPFANSSIALDERCTEGKEKDGEETDGGGALGDAAALVRACLQVEVGARPSFEKICQSRFLSGVGGWT